MKIENWIDGHHSFDENRGAAIELCQKCAEDMGVALEEVPEWAIIAVISSFFNGWEG